jgi:protein gp37
MASTTKIEWTDATVNFWIGCTEVTAACDNCYARTLAHRHGWAEWGHGQPRYKTKGARATAFALERKAEQSGHRIRAFTNSLSDFFDGEVPDEWRDEAFGVIVKTPMVDWLPLTKRPKVARDYLAKLKVPHHLCSGDGCNYCGDYDGVVPFKDYPLPNVRIGFTAENQETFDLRWKVTAEIASWGVPIFISAEPLLGPVTLPADFLALGNRTWVITGGESGAHIRNAAGYNDHARAIRDQCKAAGVAYFNKQSPGKGAIPDDLMVREFPV